MAERDEAGTGDELARERNAMRRGAGLHLFHWIVLAGSLVLTVVAWQISTQQIEEKAELRFDRQAQDVVELIVDRMARYEDALRSGAGFIRTVGGDVDYPTWAAYAHTIDIETGYPGINGMGVIHRVPRKDLDAYLREQRRFRPDYRVHPEHDQAELWPITYIEPVADNQAAVGLDMAHEANRYSAARRARDENIAVITAPITLVQDDESTPGFLFFVPYYRNDAPEELGPQTFAGIVYAPFIVKKLMEGVLAKERRDVRVRISDGDEILYDALADAAPRFSRTRDVALYGRTWTFEIHAAESLAEGSADSQPLTVLVAGVVVDLLLLALFLVMARSNRRAIDYADRVTEGLQASRDELHQAYDELAQFNYRTSHDLVGPLRTIQGFTQLAREGLAEGALDDVGFHVDRIEAQAKRLADLVNDLAALHRADHLGEDAEDIDLKKLTKAIAADLAWLREERAVAIDLGPFAVARIRSQPTRLRQILENLISNALKYSQPEAERSWVRVSSRRAGDRVEIVVEDNGLGIPADRRDAVFDMFVRAHPGAATGSGLGLYLVSKHVEKLAGSVRVEAGSEDDDAGDDAPATRFVVALPVQGASTWVSEDEASRKADGS